MHEETLDEEFQVDFSNNVLNYIDKDMNSMESVLKVKIPSLISAL